MHERLLHTAWAELAFSLNGLTTTRGERVEVIDPGVLNRGAGPDFGMAVIRLDGLKLFGNIEIHLRSSDWYRHGHQHDSSYNSIVLHVVLEDDLNESILMQDGTRPATLCLKPHITPSLRRLMDLGSANAVPCSGLIRTISGEVIDKQLKRAGREYFEEKTGKLLERYNETQPITKAWRNLLLFSLFDMLGIPGNRRPMTELLELLLLENGKGNRAGVADAFRLSGLYMATPDGMKKNAWDLKIGRPASSPKTRIPQALHLFHRILAFDIRSVPGNGPELSWKQICGTWNGITPPGCATLETCFYAAYLPCLYILGTLIHDRELQGSSYELWESARLPYASQIVKPLTDTDNRLWKYRDTPGGLYQYRSYCRRRKCDACGIFYALISA
jgi:hypothetical protein